MGYASAKLEKLSDAQYANVHLYCSGYLWTHALWTVYICQMSHVKIVSKCYQHVINNGFTISNNILSYDNYSNKTIHLR